MGEADQKPPGTEDTASMTSERARFDRIKRGVLAFAAIASISVPAFAQQSPDSVTVIYMKDGSVTRCELGWIEGDELKCRKYGGVITFRLDNIDKDRTFKESIQDQEAKTVTNHPGEVFRSDSVIISDLLVIRKLPESRERRSYSSDHGYSHEVSLKISNLGNPAQFTVHLTGYSKEGYKLRQSSFSTKSRLDPNDSKSLAEAVSLNEDDFQRISNWRITGVDKYNELRREPPQQHNIPPPRKEKRTRKDEQGRAKTKDLETASGAEQKQTQSTETRESSSALSDPECRACNSLITALSEYIKIRDSMPPSYERKVKVKQLTSAVKEVMFQTTRTSASVNEGTITYLTAAFASFVEQNELAEESRDTLRRAELRKRAWQDFDRIESRCQECLRTEER